MKNKEIIFKKCLMGVFILYLGILFLVLVLKYPTGMVSSSIRAWKNGAEVVRLEPQLIPFGTIIPYIEQARAISDWFVKNLACNIVMFMPFGILYPALAKKQKNKCRRTIISACIISICIEIFQYISAFGHCDIDDVILNVSGTALGYAIYFILKKIIDRICS